MKGQEAKRSLKLKGNKLALYVNGSLNSVYNLANATDIYINDAVEAHTVTEPYTRKVPAKKEKISIWWGCQSEGAQACTEIIIDKTQALAIVKQWFEQG